MSGASAVGTHTEESVTVSDHKVQVRHGGQGTPLLVLHNELWIPGWTSALNELSEQFEVFAPSLPGFGASECPEWVMTIDDLAYWTVALIDALDVKQPPAVVGFSLGAWIATHLAAVNRGLFDKLVLVNPVGVKPPQGEIWDYYYHTAAECFAMAFSDQTCPEYVQYYGRDWSPDEIELAEQNREMACRLTWKPYMWSHSTRERARGIKTPTLIVVSSGDRIVPNSCGESLHGAIEGSAYKVVEGAGHAVEMERPDELVRLVTEYVCAR